MQNTHHKYLQEVLIDSTTLQARIQELGAQISRDYANSDRLILICILKGGVIFMSDLARQIDVPHEMDFMAVSSYGIGARETTRNVRIEHDLKVSVTDKDILIVEDIIDSGFTLSKVVELLWTRMPRSVKICTLLDKPARRQVDIAVDYIGFGIEDKFVFGYGLDLDEKFRNLPFIGVVNLDSLTHD